MPAAPVQSGAGSYVLGAILASPALRRLLIGSVLGILQQFIGTNAVTYYAPSVLKSIGYSSSAAILANVGFSTPGLLSTAVMVFAAIDRMGRRRRVRGDRVSGVLPGDVRAQWGGIVWTVLGEMFPLHVRGTAMGVATLLTEGAGTGPPAGQPSAVTLPMRPVGSGRAGRFRASAGGRRAVRGGPLMLPDMSIRPGYAATLAGLVLAAAVGCAPQESTPTASAGCTPASLATTTKGTLTIATDSPAYPPWFVGNKPSNGKGYESAVAYAVAQRLGYDRSHVAWTVVSFNSAIAPGAKQFDFDINEFSISAERRKAVDFSAPYYTVRQAVVALKSSPIAAASTVAALRHAKLGAQVGTTSYQAIVDEVKPSTQPQVFNNNDDAKKALQNGEIDGLVVDLPTAFEISAEISGARIVGQLPRLGGRAEQFGIVLDKGSPLTGCVSKAVDALRANKTLAKLESRWLSADAGAPELT